MAPDVEAHPEPLEPVEPDAEPDRQPGMEPDGEPKMRPYAVRMGHAFGELIEHLPTDSFPQAGGLAASVTVILDWQTLASGVGAATLSTGTRVSAGQARRLACNAGLIPAVLADDSVCLDMGRARRLHTRYQRTAIALTQRGCIWPGCDRPPAWCEIHHVRPWARGGATDLEAAMLCPRHHHLAHQDWQIRMGDEGVPEVIAPARIDPTRTPQRHHRFRRRS